MEGDEFRFIDIPQKEATADYADATLGYYTLRVAGILVEASPEPPDDTHAAIRGEFVDVITMMGAPTTAVPPSDDGSLV